MAGRSNAFRGGVNDPINKITYHMEDLGDQVSVDAMDHDGEATSGALFEYDHGNKSWEVVPGSLSLHPRHAALGVGRAMHRMVNAKY